MSMPTVSIIIQFLLVLNHIFLNSNYITLYDFKVLMSFIELIFVKRLFKFTI
jgi:hypothetical protein